jgi:hypothetical protein
MEDQRRVREESGKKWRRAWRIDTRGEVSRVRSAGELEGLEQFSQAGWNCGDRPDTEPEAERRRV